MVPGLFPPTKEARPQQLIVEKDGSGRFVFWSATDVELPAKIVIAAWDLNGCLIFYDAEQVHVFREPLVESPTFTSFIFIFPEKTFPKTPTQLAIYVDDECAVQRIVQREADLVELSPGCASSTAVTVCAGDDNYHPPIIIPPCGGSAQPGPAGPPGETDPLKITRIANRALSGHRVMKPLAARKVDYMSADNSSDMLFFLGVSEGAASEEDNIILVTEGRMVESTWTWTVGNPIYVGVDGALTQTPNNGWMFVQIIALAISATEIYISPQPAIQIN